MSNDKPRAILYHCGTWNEWQVESCRKDSEEAGYEVDFDAAVRGTAHAVGAELI